MCQEAAITTDPQGKEYLLHLATPKKLKILDCPELETCYIKGTGIIVWPIEDIPHSKIQIIAVFQCMEVYIEDHYATDQRWREEAV